VQEPEEAPSRLAQGLAAHKDYELMSNEDDRQGKTGTDAIRNHSVEQEALPTQAASVEKRTPPGAPQNKILSSTAPCIFHQLRLRVELITGIPQKEDDIQYGLHFTEDGYEGHVLFSSLADLVLAGPPSPFTQDAILNAAQHALRALPRPLQTTAMAGAETEPTSRKHRHLIQLATEIQNSAKELQELVTNQSDPAKNTNREVSSLSPSDPSSGTRRGTHPHPEGMSTSAGSSTNSNRWVFRCPHAKCRRDCDDLLEEVE
jgi:hypothetical protein